MYLHNGDMLKTGTIVFGLLTTGLKILKILILGLNRSNNRKTISQAKKIYQELVYTVIGAQKSIIN